MKALFQLLLIVGSFFAIWFALSKIDFTGRYELDTLSEKNEKKLGSLIWEAIESSEEVIRKDSVNYIVETITERICKENKIDYKKVKVHVIDKDEVNAFTLPDRHLVVYKGLITYSKSPEEVAGVIAHELAHMELNHVMKKLIKEVGLSMLFAIAGGNGSFEILTEVGKTLSGTAFDREQEREADMKAIDLMAQAEIDPVHLANFLFRLSANDSDYSDELELISTHPGSKERAAQILTEIKDKKITPKLFEFGDWELIRDPEWQGY